MTLVTQDAMLMCHIISLPSMPCSCAILYRYPACHAHVPYYIVIQHAMLMCHIISLSSMPCSCAILYRYPACNAHAPYYIVTQHAMLMRHIISLPSMPCSCAILYRHLWPIWLYRIFPHYLINGMIFWKKIVIEHKMCILIFSTTFV
jgi:hypothetical protein